MFLSSFIQIPAGGLIQSVCQLIKMSTDVDKDANTYRTVVEEEMFAGADIESMFFIHGCKRNTYDVKCSNEK